MPPDLNVNSIANGAGTGPTAFTGQWAPRAYGAVSISGGTPTLQQSGNVSSVTDNGVGLIQLNLTSAFSAATYAPFASCESSASILHGDIDNGARLAGSLEVEVVTTGGTHTDPPSLSGAGMGDLA